MKKPRTTRSRPRRRERALVAKAPETAFPVVAIGTSAGGLDALEQFLKAVPARSGMSFVVVQHMDPTRKGMLVELLGRVSPIPVVAVTDGMRVQANHVHVIPPNKDMSIARGVLRLLEPIAPRGLRLPIDFFFRSLADDLREKSIGVVLSGMGSDGTLGLRAIREKAGGVFVQEPASAQFEGMPRSAIDSGVVDVVAPAAQLPGKIAEYLQHAHPLERHADAVPDARTESALEKIIRLLRSTTGHDFAPYKTSTLHRRIERRMGLHQINDVTHYVRYLRENAAEADILFKELLIGVTTFFRDPEAWDRLKTEVLARLVATSPKNAVLRAWVPACSTGEEAYSLAIAFNEALRDVGGANRISLQIFATDLDGNAVERARRGTYPSSIASEVSRERLDQFFVEEGQDGYRVRKEIRDSVVFATQNVLQDPPFTKLDVLTCRNLLIYLTADVQRRVLPLFHYSLKPGGTLFLGSAETVGTFTDLFTPLDGKARLYTRLETALGGSLSVDFPSAYARTGVSQLATARRATEAASASSLQAHVEAILLRRFAPAGVLVSRTGDVLFVSGRAGTYLEVPAGKTNWNILAMARDGLRHSIEGALDEAVRTKSAVTLAGVRLRGRGEAQTVDVTVQPLDEPAALRGTVLVVFADVDTSSERRSTRTALGPARRDARARLERELLQAREELRVTREEAQSAQEEQKSTNEELQSTNEELTTSKEEVQSMNEELQTLNGELQAKVDDLSRASNDMKNLLDSTAIAVLFLDDALRVRRFTPQAATLIKLIPGDVGRPLADLATTLRYPALYDDAREVLRSLVFKTTNVSAEDGRRFGVRIMPYRTSDNRIDGVVITFVSLADASAAPPRSKRMPLG